eukprot:scaffold2751_cov131-Cylindrotheca_fusiformis.AAC.34
MFSETSFSKCLHTCGTTDWGNTLQYYDLELSELPWDSAIGPLDLLPFDSLLLSRLFIAVLQSDKPSASSSWSIARLYGVSEAWTMRRSQAFLHTLLAFGLPHLAHRVARRRIYNNYGRASLEDASEKVLVSAHGVSILDK